MRAGKLDRSITLQRGSNTVDAYGAPLFTWEDIAAPRAQIIQTNTEEFLRAFGASEETAIIFRTRFLDGVTTADRILFGGEAFNIREMKEIGRRRGLELRCVRAV